MKYFIFRNYTVELFFDNLDAQFSGYENVLNIDETSDRYIWCYLPKYNVNEELIAKEIDSLENILQWVIQKLDKNKPVIIFTMRRIFSIIYETSDDKVEIAIESYNNKLRMLASENSNIKIVDLGNFYDKYAKVNLIDWKFYYLSQMPWDPKLINIFKSWFAGQMEAVELKRKKCLVLDLDNTLWGGVLGEEGVDGIKIGGGYPGNAFLFFQQSLLELSRNGIILTACSKNNEEDVFEAWERHPNMILRKKHFAAYRINWKNKADNILEIANELNLGLDSFVFVDDNPSERELIKQMLPMVKVPAFPAHPYLLPVFTQSIVDTYFKTYKLTDEDSVKTKQYIENALRKQSETQFSNFDEYLKSLEIDLQIERLDDFNVARFSQMTQKTNQFNLTTIRYTESELRSICNIGGQIYGLRVKDKFGDNGLTGLIILKFEKKTAIIDSFLLSCRILGKNIEYVFIEYILMKLKKQGIVEIVAQYYPSNKNIQVLNFYEKAGFLLIDELEDKKYYALDLEKVNYSISSIYKVKEIQ